MLVYQRVSAGTSDFFGLESFGMSQVGSQHLTAVPSSKFAPPNTIASSSAVLALCKNSWASNNETAWNCHQKHFRHLLNPKSTWCFFLLGFLGNSCKILQDLSSLADILSCVSGNLSCGATRNTRGNVKTKGQANREPMQRPGATAARFFPIAAIALQNSHEEGISMDWFKGKSAGKPHI